MPTPARTPARPVVRFLWAAAVAAVVLTVAVSLDQPARATASAVPSLPPVVVEQAPAPAVERTPAPTLACRVLDPGSVVCAPALSPDGAPAVAVGEDGSAGYADGWAVDPDGADGAGVPSWVRPGQAFRVA